MFNNRHSLEHTLFPAALATGALVVAGYLQLYEPLSSWKGLGFLVGLLGGFVSFVVGAMRRSRGSRQVLLRAVELLLSPLGFVMLLPFHVALAGGYFLGSVVSFCMTWSASSISERPANPEPAHPAHGEH